MIFIGTVKVDDKCKIIDVSDSNLVILLKYEKVKCSSTLLHVGLLLKLLL